MSAEAPIRLLTPEEQARVRAVKAKPLDTLTREEMQLISPPCQQTSRTGAR